MVIIGRAYLLMALATASLVVYLSRRVEARWLGISVQNLL